MNQGQGVAVSFLLHILMVISYLSFYKYCSGRQVDDSVHLSFQYGGVPQTRLSFSSQTGKGESKSLSSSSNAGNPLEEVERFKNEIHYPAEALEQRLESQCKWEVTIGPEGKAAQVKTVEPCRYPIFEKHFRKALSQWQFHLESGTTLLIPISFRIDSND
ncbi:hypothetical protein CH373_00505 [Leptospira perolatii]|uniref:TonB C-terminal domain-containing protein n=1 Tax=Leptospira perolatii TaxID=2023191 RepID=A0A2M9ZR65_9LEPT|nr:energy transducer TonB [Leptospira perolatii]PJZ71045.1 hypothetical protein CH360_00505 [Leptospira perolatii]PJZ74577.1 hypothetical protein CH373_00505 [Leptospira perolatii]